MRMGEGNECYEKQQSVMKEYFTLLFGLYDNTKIAVGLSLNNPG